MEGLPLKGAGKGPGPCPASPTTYLSNDRPLSPLLCPLRPTPQTEVTLPFLISLLLILPQSLSSQDWRVGIWGELGKASCQGLTLSCWCGPSPTPTLGHNHSGEPSLPDMVWTLGGAWDWARTPGANAPCGCLGPGLVEPLYSPSGKKRLQQGFLLRLPEGVY